MANVLCTWELGAGLGHLDRLGIVSRELARRGHAVIAAVRDLQRAASRLQGSASRILQAPIRLPRTLRVPFLGNYASVLAAAGWLDAQGLAGQLSAWKALFELLEPDLVLADHSPTAVLAARSIGLPCCVIGNSFQVPPCGDPFPPILHWMTGEQAKCAAYDAVALRPANDALSGLGWSPMGSLSELFAGSQRMVLGLPELNHYDHYGDGTRTLGPSFAEDNGLAAAWPTAAGPRVFGYLDGNHPELQGVLSALTALGWPAVVFVRGIAEEEACRLSGPSLQVSARPLSVAQCLAQAHIAITHASIGTVSAAALAGCVQLAIPSQTEQWMVGHRIVEAGIGLCVPLGVQGTPYEAWLGELAGNRRFTEAARTLAARHRDANPAVTAERAADWIEAALMDRAG